VPLRGEPDMTALPDVSSHVMAHSRWRGSEIVFWILALSCAFLFPSRYLIMTDIVRLALFALSLDLILAMPASCRWSRRLLRCRRLLCWAAGAARHH